MKMGLIEFHSITPETLPFVQRLLFERNGTAYAYTAWKYGENSPEGFRGVVAIKGNEPVGCFGLIPKVLNAGDKQIPCSWFADWYVMPQARGEGVGGALLQALSSHGQPVFGHPGPVQAQGLCKANGYKLLGFQSRRRLVLQRWAYQRRRASSIGKATLRFAHGYIRALIERLRPVRVETIAHPSSPAAYFSRPVSFWEWMWKQPVTPTILRTHGLWQSAEIEVRYFDDLFPSGERRRLLLHTMGEGWERPRALLPFLKSSQDAQCAYIDIFTTERSVDNAWQALGALFVSEAPLVVKGLPNFVKEIALHGCDRENWTYQAADYVPRPNYCRVQT